MEYPLVLYRTVIALRKAMHIASFAFQLKSATIDWVPYTAITNAES